MKLSVMLQVFSLAACLLCTNVCAQTPSKCKLLEIGHHQTAARIQNGIVAFRSFPFSDIKRIEIPPNGEGLLDVIAQQDSISVLIETLRSPRAKSSTSSRNLFLAGESTPNAILVARGNLIVVFPRALLIHPLVQRATIRPGDFVATFKLTELSAVRQADGDRDETKLNQLAGLNRDSIHRWYNNAVASERSKGAVEVSLGRMFRGRLEQTTVRFQPDGLRPRTDLLSLLNDYPKFAGWNNYSSSDKAQPLVVSLRRKINAITFVQIAPFAPEGSFSVESELLDRLVKGEIGSDLAAWEALFEGFIGPPLMDNDQIEVLPITQLPVFSNVTF